MERTASGASSSFRRWNSRNPQPGPSSDRKRKVKHSFCGEGTDNNHANSSKSGDSGPDYKACCMCGSRETCHRPKSCSAPTLAYSQPIPLSASATAQTATPLLKNGGINFCIGYNTGGRTWMDCRLAQQCSLCGRDKCSRSPAPSCLVSGD
ncbi:hypothetical protein V8E36_003053 [Tilletia maclaganii]